MATRDMSGIRTENEMPQEAHPMASPMTKYHLARIAMGSVALLASLACAAISLAWVKWPTIPFFGPFSLPLYGLPYPVLSLLWQSAEFFKASRNNRDTGFSAATHLICDLFLSVVGIALAVAFVVVFQYVKGFFDEVPEMYSDSDWYLLNVEDLSESQKFSQWMTTVFMWSGMALVAGLSHFLISILSYLEIRRRYKSLEKQSHPALDAAPPYLEPSSKPLLTAAQAAVAHQLPSEALGHEPPQEVGESSRAVEMPGANLNEMGMSVVSVGGPRRSNDQDSLQEDT